MLKIRIFCGLNSYFIDWVSNPSFLKKNDFTKVEKRRSFLANRGGISQTPGSNDLCSSLTTVERKAATCYETNTTHTTLLPLTNALHFSCVLLE